MLETLQKQRDDLIASGKIKTGSLKDLDVEIQKLTVDAKTYDMKKVTDGLNNELAKVKEEYELAVEFDANPELGGVFADMMGINADELNQLPRTYEQVVAKLQAQVDKLFTDNNIDKQFDLVSLLNKNDFEAWAKAQGNTLDDSFIKALDNIRQYANKVRLDEASETTKNWSQLVEKYGDLQAKLVKIAKDTSKEQFNIIKKFGTENEKQQALNISEKLNIEQDPDTVSRLQRELADLMNRVVQGNPQAVNIATATENEGESLKSKASWEDFQQSELDAMTFEDMSRVSTSAIQLIIDKLEELRGKVQEDPASMKALTKSLEDARKELEGRSGTLTIVNAIKEYKTATIDLASARQNLAGANSALTDAENQLNEAEQAGDATAVAKAVDNLRRAREKQKEAEEDVVRGENNVKKSTNKLQAGMETLSGELQNIQGLFGVVAKLFAAGGDDKTAEAINAISEGFSIMTTIIMGVVGAMVLLESTQPWLLAIAAALGVIVGLVSWLSGNDNEEIDNAVKESERAVKRLEIAYKDLEDAVNNAYGASISGAKRAALANKELQLVEIKRQIQLEKSRDSKDRDEDKILDLQAQYKDLLLEIKNGVTDIVNEMLGISSVGDGITSIVEAMIDAFRNGEDAMEAFSKKWDEMIDSMILKLIVSEYMKKAWDNVMKTLKQKEEEFLKKSSEDKAAAQAELSKYESMSETEGVIEFVKNRFGMGSGEWMKLVYTESGYKELKEMYVNYLKSLHSQLANAESAGEQASEDYLKWSLDYMMGEGRDYMTKFGQNLADALGNWYTFGQDSDKTLSALQQGIQGITEDTAGALEAYMNGVSQQVYLHSDLLTQIRDAIVGIDIDVQTATQAQMLLQLQQSYTVQMAIRGILEGWNNPSGQAVRVELVS